MKYEVTYMREVNGTMFIEADSPDKAIELAEDVLANGEEFQSPFDADTTDDWVVLGVNGISVDGIESANGNGQTGKEGAR